MTIKRLPSAAASALVGAHVPACTPRDAVDYAVARAGDDTAFLHVLMGDEDTVDAISGSMIHHGERVVLVSDSRARGTLYMQRADDRRAWQVSAVYRGEVVLSVLRRGRLVEAYRGVLRDLTRLVETAGSEDE